MARYNISINDSTASDHDSHVMKMMKFTGNRYYAKLAFVGVLSAIEIPVMILTLIALCFLIKSRPAASVFVSHLILSDLIQVICMLKNTFFTEQMDAYYYSLIVGLYFMACVAFERYLLVSHPIWYKSHHSLKLSCFISSLIWFVPLIFAEIFLYFMKFEIVRLCIACLIPYPIIILCLAGTWRGLSHSISLTYLKRKLILGSLSLVLLTYTFLILPFVITHLLIKCNLVSYTVLFAKFYHFAKLLLYFNPLADCLLYLFMRPDVGNVMKSVHCCISAQNPASHSVNTCSSV